MNEDFQETLESIKEQLRAEWRSDITSLESVLEASFQDLQIVFEGIQNAHDDEKRAWHQRMLTIEMEATSVRKHLKALSISVRELNKELEEFNSR
jgi:hypothetical protein